MKCAIALGLIGALFVMFQPYRVNFERSFPTLGLPEFNETQASHGLSRLNWNERCYPRYNKTWVGGTSRSSFDPPGMELPLHIWSAVPSFRQGEEELVIMGPMGSSAGRGAKSPAKNFSQYRFECYFPETNSTVPGKIQKDPHGNVAVIRCRLPENDPLKMGKMSTTVEFHDLTHNGYVTLAACAHPKSKHEYELTAVIVARDTACQLETWLEHLFLLGFDHVFLYDHFNEDSETLKILQRYVSQGLLTVFPWHLSRDKLWAGKFDREQVVLYNDAIYRFRSKWLYVADLDEFPFFGILMQPPGIPTPVFYNQSKFNPPTDRKGVSQPISAEAQLSLLPKPDFTMPTLPQLNVSDFSRDRLRNYFLAYLDYLDAKSQFKLGEVSLMQALFGTGRGPHLIERDICPATGESVLSEQFMRADIPEPAKFPSMRWRKYIARTERVNVVSVHMITNGGIRVNAPMDELRLHHYWRAGRGVRLDVNAYLDTSAVPWASIVAHRVQKRRDGSLIGLT